jgi:hypothetical protein
MPYIEPFPPTFAGRLDSNDAQYSRFLLLVGDFDVILVLWEGLKGDCLGDFVVGSTLTEQRHFVDRPLQ